MHVIADDNLNKNNDKNRRKPPPPRYVQPSTTWWITCIYNLFNFFFKQLSSFEKFNSPFMKKIPPGAEVNNVLVGEVDFLDKPVSAFVRLAKATSMGDFTEVPVPSRFVFLLLGPKVLL